MRKKRILIRAFNCRRDVAPASLLARILEMFGCDVWISSSREFLFCLKYWKPDVVIITVPGQAKIVKGCSPKSKIVFLDGEGMNSRGQFWTDFPETYEALDLVLSWGKQQVVSHIENFPNLDPSKLHVIGNPKLDLVRYATKKHEYKANSKQIGVVGRYALINRYDGRPIIWNIDHPFALEAMIAESKNFHSVIKIAKALLERTDYNISIRPYTLEQIESYHEFKEKWFGPELSDRVSINESLYFAEWATENKFILSPTSTSFLESYLLGVPVINIERIADTTEFGKNEFMLNEEWQKAATMPESVDQLVDIIENDPPSVEVNEEIDQQLTDYSDWDSGRSASFRAAKYIVEYLENEPVTNNWLHLPTPLLEVVDRILFKRALKINRLHPNLNYRRGYHKLADYLDEMVAKILKDEGWTKSPK